MFRSALALLAVLSPSVHASYDWAFGNSSVWLASTAYCSPDSYLTRTYKGYAAGFVPTYHIEVLKDATQGFIGYMPSQSTIYVSFRGSEQIQNWIDNLNAILTSYPLCSGCEVHQGFYNAHTAAFPAVLSEVKRLKSQFPSYGVVVTGHSLGAALATLTALDLMSNGISGVRAIHFGSPRVG